MANANMKYIVNELLMYTFSKLDTDTPVDVKDVLNSFYGDENVESAKAVLWEHFQDKLERNINRRSKLKNIEDILEAARVIGAAFPDKDALPVVFVAARTSNLPFVCQKMVPSRDISIMDRLAVLEKEMKEVRSTRMPAAPPAAVPNRDMYSQRLQLGNPQGPQMRARPGAPNQQAHHAEREIRPPPTHTNVQMGAQGPEPNAGPLAERTGPYDDNGFRTVDYHRKRRRPQAIYGTKQSDGLKAPPRCYECVVFNVTSDKTDDVKTWMTENNVTATDVSRLSKDDRDTHMFRVKVLFKDKETVLSGEFWPEHVGCRRYTYPRVDRTRENRENNNNNGES